MAGDGGRLVAVEVNAPPPGPMNAFIDDERRVAMRDLLAENVFAPAGRSGDFRLTLAIVEDQLRFAISDADGAPVAEPAVPLKPLRRIVKDYFLICDSYYAALRSARPAQIETIDMGRRGIHNEGAEVLADELDGKVTVDFETARRLFTLVCALHLRGQDTVTG